MLKKIKNWIKKFLWWIQEEGFLEAVHFFYIFLSGKIMKRLFPNPSFQTGQVAFISGLSSGNVRALSKAKKCIRFSEWEKFSIEGQYVCVYGEQQTFAQQSTVIVAHWDPEQIIDPYVKCLCRHFKNLGYKVILSSAQPLKSDITLERFEDWADAIIYRTCVGYDFTSWKAALDCFPSLYSCTELLLTNDSYFGPFGSCKPVHDRMNAVKCDFWGLIYSTQRMPHLQSFYLVLKQSVIQHESFKNFIDAIPLTADRKKIINYELSLGIYLSMHGFQGAAYASLAGEYSYYNPSLAYFDSLMAHGVPFIKREKIYSRDGLTKFFECKEQNSTSQTWNVTHNYLLRMGGLPNTATSFASRASLGLPSKDYENFPQSIIPNYEYVDFSTEVSKGPWSDSSVPPSIAIALHCFYPETMDHVLFYLSALPSTCHLYVTTDTEEKKIEIEQKLQHFSFAHMEIRLCPNVGWDMAPFFIGLGDVLLQYEFILKIHVKKFFNMNPHFAHAWREVLYGSLMGNAQKVQSILDAFVTNERLGVIAPPTYPTYVLPLQGANHSIMQSILRKKGLELPIDSCIDFPVGGMFWCRSKVLRSWLDLNLTYDDFGIITANQHDGTLAHALERLIFWGCGFEDMKWTRTKPFEFEQ